MTTLNRRPSLRSDLIVRQIDEDFAVYDPITDDTALLNVSAAAVLGFCDGLHSLEQIELEMAELFALDAGSVAGDVKTVLATFDSRRWLDAD